MVLRRESEQLLVVGRAGERAVQGPVAEIETDRRAAGDAPDQATGGLVLDLGCSRPSSTAATPAYTAYHNASWAAVTWAAPNMTRQPAGRRDPKGVTTTSKWRQGGVDPGPMRAAQHDQVIIAAHDPRATGSGMSPVARPDPFPSGLRYREEIILSG